MKVKSLLVIIIFLALLVRVIPIDFPKFTVDEARIAYRGSVLKAEGKDELGRPFPLLFNSLDDYQFPATSYVTALGELIFGKSELGARLPFIIMGTLTVFLTYLIAKKYNSNPKFYLLATFVVAFSPPLIFLSKVPNETIILSLLFTLLFYLLINSPPNIFRIIFTVIAIIFTSKLSFFLLIPFIAYVIYLNKEIDKKFKVKILMISSLIVLFAFVLFMQVPQAKRSIVENNFSVSSSLAISNGINSLRGEGLQSGWNPILERLLFNKLHYISSSLLHYFSHFNPALFFGQLDKSGIFNYFQAGAWSKILIIPFILGLIVCVREDKKILKVFPLFLILIYPAFFSYPKINIEVLILILPFMALIIAAGSLKIYKFIPIILAIVFIEFVSINVNAEVGMRSSAGIRPFWIKSVLKDIPVNEKVAISDTLVSDIVPFIEWHTPFIHSNGFEEVNSPYKFIQYDLRNIKIINSNNRLSGCVEEEYTVLLGERDLNKFQQPLNLTVAKSYQNQDGKDVGFLLSNKLCLE